MISVIIPTYNRKDKLIETFKTLEGQTLDKNEFEVIVVDDGSTDGTREFLKEFATKTILKLRYFFQEHQGPGRARNFGASQANGSVVYFCGDDTFLEKDLLNIHYNLQKEHENIAVLGLALWDESEEVSDFMRYVAPGGPQFHYNTIKDKNNAGFNHFYTCNISLEKKWFDLEKFDEDLTFASLEDIEFGYRLARRGLKVLYEPRARVFHSHHQEPEDFYRKIFQGGQNLVIFLNKYKKQDKKGYYTIKRKYAPFSFFGGTKIFNKVSLLFSRSRLLKRINIKYHWFWSICYHYSLGIHHNVRNKRV
jgi:glycosyltransferase involved in cell wall biosynthesis